MWNKYDFKELGEGLQRNALPNCTGSCSSA